jgi:hypothetical protein
MWLDQDPFEPPTPALSRWIFEGQFQVPDTVEVPLFKLYARDLDFPSWLILVFKLAADLGDRFAEVVG